MRALEVLGLADDGGQLVCQDPNTGEEFAVPADERLRAAARGDLTRLGQLEIEMESQLRPREIQARIRAGATVAEVAAAAGTSPSRIEGFAYPVLMERSAVADRAVKAHPIGRHGPAAITIAEVVAETLSSRGHAGSIDWDAFKEPNGWVLVARWKTGRSENVAQFAYHPGPDNGTVTPRGETAVDLMDPAPKPLRTVADPAPSGGSAAPDPLSLAATQRIPVIDSTPADTADGPEILVQERPQLPARGRKPSVKAAMAATTKSAEPDAEAEQLVTETVTDERAGAHPVKTEAVARTGTDHASAHPGGRGRRSAKPSMPSWDDVLLGSGLGKR